tara:strand:+ start:425 stop:1303 length:879 start_codon:yes stop_codon:yes gene_type:complete
MTMSDDDSTSKESAIHKSADRLARKNESPAKNAANWLQTVHQGTLSTISIKDEIKGFPNGSIVPFALDKDGKPFILVAEIATHTANMINSNKASLFLSDPEAKGDPQSSWRISVIGQMKRVIPERKMDKFTSEVSDASLQISDEEEKIMLARYIERVPNAKSYLMTHNFCFWKMDEIKAIRYIAGFGKICWIDGSELVEEMNSSDIVEVESGTIEHMNDDHEDSMITICQGMHNFTPTGAELLHIDSGGMIIKTSNPEEHIYCSFTNRITAEELRYAVVDVVKRARKMSNDE